MRNFIKLLLYLHIFLLFGEEETRETATDKEEENNDKNEKSAINQKEK